MSDVYSLVLAAKEDVNSASPLVLNSLCQKPVIDFVVEAASALSDNMPVVVVGEKRQPLMEHLADRCMFAFSNNQGGSAAYAHTARHIFKNRKGTVIVLQGNMPLVKESTLKKALDFHIKRKNAVTVITTTAPYQSEGYVVPGESNRLFSVLCGEAPGAEASIGVYFFNIEVLNDKINIAERNASASLLDVVSLCIEEGLPVCNYRILDETEAISVNCGMDLYHAQKAMQRRINFAHIENGVTIIDPEATYIGPDVKIGEGSVIYPIVTMEGETTIGRGCTVYQNTIIKNSKIGDFNSITSSVITDSEIENNVSVGPFAYIRPKCHVGSGVKVGDFVELKNATIGDNTKISHLTYVGDSTVGSSVNFGCGTVTVNYDGQAKYRTVIGDRAFIGCNTNLVSPVNVGSGAYIAAGSTITEDVPNDCLAIARQRQVVKKEWNDRRKK